MYFPAHRRQVLQQRTIDAVTVAPQRMRRPLQVFDMVDLTEEARQLPLIISARLNRETLK